MPCATTRRTRTTAPCSKPGPKRESQSGAPSARPDCHEERGRERPAGDVADGGTLFLATAPSLRGGDGMQEGRVGGQTHLASEAGDLGGGAVHSERCGVEAGRPAHERAQDQHVDALHREGDEAGRGGGHREREKIPRVRPDGRRSPLRRGAAGQGPARQQVRGEAAGGEAAHGREHGRLGRPDQAWQAQPHERDEGDDLPEVLEQAAGERVVLHDAQAARGSVRDPIEGDRGKGQQHHALRRHHVGRLADGAPDPAERQPRDAAHEAAQAQARGQREPEDRSRPTRVALGPTAGDESGRPLIESERPHLAQQVGRGPGQEEAAEGRLAEQPRDEEREQRAQGPHGDGEDVRGDPAEQRRCRRGRHRAVAVADREARTVPEGARGHFAHLAAAGLKRT